MSDEITIEQLRNILNRIDNSTEQKNNSEDLTATRKAFLAMMMDSIEIIEELLPEVDLDEQNANGFTLLDLAEKLDRNNVADLLREEQKRRHKKVSDNEEPPQKKRRIKK